MKGPKFRDSYEQLLCHLLGGQSVEETNERTKRKVKVSRAFSFDVNLADGLLPVCGIRKMFPKTAAAEVAWFLQGTKDSTFIQKYAPIWDKFVEDDGVSVDSAYGYRWLRHFGRDQIADALGALVRDHTDRRVWVQAWDPSTDGLGASGQKNVPCPIGFTLSITGGHLNSSIILRSSDVFVGLPYDVMGHALLMDAFVASYNELMLANGSPLKQIGLGLMHVTLAHPHLYDVHYSDAENALYKGHTSDDSRRMPGWTLREIQQYPQGYVEEVQSRFADVKQPSFSCRPEVVQ